VKDIIVLKDKATGQPRGCAFVSYATREEAEAAIRHLDRRVQLPGALNKLEVRFARSHQYVQASAGPEDNRQLFFARAPPTATEAEMYALFAKFGPVVEVNVFKERRNNQSKGCGFVTMGTRESAVAAMDALDERHLLVGGWGCSGRSGLTGHFCGSMNVGSAKSRLGQQAHPFSFRARRTAPSRPWL